MLHKSDVEELIGKRPFKEDKILEVESAVTIAPTETTVIGENEKI